jgi:hypothetical protein
VTKHAVLSPSSSHRWMACPGSVVLEADEPNRDNEHSKEGTLAHSVGAHCLEKKVPVKDMLFHTMEDGEVHIVPMEMRDPVEEYVDLMLEKSKGHLLMVEQKLDLSNITGEQGATGTADSVIIYEFPKHRRLGIYDYKHGYREVSVQGNSQLGLYLLGGDDTFGISGEFDSYEIGIVQSRIGNIETEIWTPEELRLFREKVVAAVKRVREAQKSNSLDGFLIPGAKQCEWCKAKYKCPALAAEVIKATAIDFEDETQTELIEPVDLAKAGAKLALVENWIKGVRAKITSELFSGNPVKGWKLVEGKKGNRSFIDETDAKKELIAAGADPKDITETKLLTPAKIEKKLKGNDKALNLLPKLYSQKAGKPAVAPISDKRPAYTLKPEDDFSDVGDDE